MLRGNRGVTFVDGGAGVVFFYAGILSDKMEFLSFEFDDDQVYALIVEEFRKILATIPAFRLHAVTGNLRFEKM